MEKRYQQHCQLEALLAQYLKNWGPIRWQADLAASRVTRNLKLAKVVLGLSGIETDSQMIYRKLHLARLDRDAVVREFNISWLAEEAEHGRALRHLAGLLGEEKNPPTRKDRPWDIRFAMAGPTLFAARAVPHLQATYLTLGSMQEYVALTTYREVARLIGDPHVSRVLSQISAQEGRHMRFYRGAAQVFLREEIAQKVTSHILGRFWRPPGVDLLGLDSWLDSFSVLLQDAQYRSRLIDGDRIIRSLPGLGNVALMPRFLAQLGYEVPANRVRLKSSSAVSLDLS